MPTLHRQAADDGTASSPAPAGPPTPPGEARPDLPSPEADAIPNALAMARSLRLQTVDASRVLPIFSPGSGTLADAAIRYCAILQPASAAAPAKTQLPPGPFARLTQWLASTAAPGVPQIPASEDLSFDLLGPQYWQRYAGGVLADQGPNALGFVPVVRYINQVAPIPGVLLPGGTGAGGVAGVDPVDGIGLSDVEPLIPMQDELNTRLSDRANRVTLQSFRMYLAKGIEDFVKRPIGPGQMWSTENPNATITAFGGDAAAPSEDSHITEVREALDKISGVTPVAAGLLHDRVGHLTSAVALRITLIALLARTEKKRQALALALREICAGVLAILDATGILETPIADRAVDIHWPSPLPANETETLTLAKLKLELGISRDVVLRELGYGG